MVAGRSRVGDEDGCWELDRLSLLLLGCGWDWLWEEEEEEEEADLLSCLCFDDERPLSRLVRPERGGRPPEEEDDEVVPRGSEIEDLSADRDADDDDPISRVRGPPLDCVGGCEEEAEDAAPAAEAAATASAVAVPWRCTKSSSAPRRASCLDMRTSCCVPKASCLSNNVSCLSARLSSFSIT
jgi:hypothetical protein